MRNYIGLILVGFLFCTGSTVWGQSSAIKSFTPDKATFIEELNQMLVENTQGVRKKEGKEIMDEFTIVWNADNFTPAERQSIYKTCNLMLKKRMRPFPDYKNYINALNNFIRTSQPKASFSVFQSSLEGLINGKSKKKFSDYLTFCYNLFRENAIHKSPTALWKSDNNHYQLEYADGKPKVVFPALKLSCFAKKQNAEILNTSGVYYPLEYKWVGEGGVVNWLRAGLDENSVYANLGHYEIMTKSAKYEADSVSFINKEYFNQPLIGKLTDKVLANVTTVNATYPRFQSYSRRLKIKDLVEKVDYDGGFSQHGGKFIGAGTDDQPAYLIFHREGKPFLTATSKAFIIKEDRISSKRAAIIIRLDTDSIVHPGLHLKFQKDNRTLTLLRTDEGVNKSPYFNSYHMVDMYVEILKWKIDDPIIHMETITGSSNKTAKFESDAFFREYRFDRLQGLANTHPLVLIKDCVESTGTEELYSKEVSRCMQLSVSQVRPMLMSMSNLGFFTFDYINDRIIVKERLYHYIEAKSKLRDSDVIEVRSKIGDKSNASINLVDDIFDMTIRGISRITLSDSHNVVLYPVGGEILMKKNRDFDFGGIITAGKFEFFGNNYSFLYDDFRIEMPNVDSARLNVETGKRDEQGRKKRVKVRTVIEHVNGELQIDHPNNKSGKEDLPKYPIFTSLKESYTFYDKEEVQGGTYNRDDFYFQLEPFKFDSLDNFRNERILFDGKFHSGGIFPEFEETLTLQEDFSLGFSRPTPKKGFPIYGGKGTYKKKIKLSHEGLRGDGTLKYLTSTSKSDDFLFLPRLMVATAQKLVIEEQFNDPQYPPVTGINVLEEWAPYKDSMHIATIDEPLTFYDGNSRHIGHMLLRPDGLTGGGTFAFDQAELDSRLFLFKFSEFFSDTADFRLKSANEISNSIQFDTKNVNVHIDFKTRIGKFVSNGEAEPVNFEENQYIAFMDRFTWYMDDATIELSAGKSKQKQGAGELQFEGAKFISTHPKQDSLYFYSAAAKYDLRTSIIKAEKVEYIPVADAFIYPDSSKVTILKKAKMKTLENAYILANATTKYHRIDSVSVNIFARRNYAGSGIYSYIDEDQQSQRIKFTTITVDSSDQTYATGAINEEDKFFLSPFFEYKGVVRLAASKKSLLFSGNTRILHSCDNISKNWLKFSSEVDPEEIYIPVETVPLDIDNNNLSASVMISPDSTGIYSTFLSPRQSPADRKVMPAEGYLFFDRESSEYRISNISKLNELNLPGNYLSLNTKECTVYGEGNLSFGTNLGQVKARPVGNVTHNTVSNKVEFDMMLLVDFFFVEKALERMATSMVEYGNLDPVDFDRPVYEKGLRELLNAEEADKLIAQLALGSFKRFPTELEKSMFLTDVKMKWNEETNSFQSSGKIGVGNILKKQVNLMVDGRIEVIKKRSGDVISIYLEMDKNNWYFFTYSRNLMAAFSSDDTFNSEITELKADKRKQKTEKGQSPYTFMTSSKRKRRDFLARFVGS